MGMGTLKRKSVLQILISLMNAFSNILKRNRKPKRFKNIFQRNYLYPAKNFMPNCSPHTSFGEPRYRNLQSKVPAQPVRWSDVII